MAKLFEGLRILLNRKGEHEHYLGGEFSGPGGKCPGCGRKLVVYLSLDLRDSRIRFPDEHLRRVQLVYCFDCEMSDFDFAYRLTHQGGVEVLLGLRSAADRDEAGADLLRKKHMNVVLASVPAQLEELAEKLNSGRELNGGEKRTFAELTGNFAPVEVGGYPIVDTYNQVGGRAFLVQRLDDPECQFCTKRRGPKMRFLASICNERTADIQIVPDDVQVVFFVCPQCSAILVQHSAS